MAIGFRARRLHICTHRCEVLWEEAAKAGMAMGPGAVMAEIGLAPGGETCLRMEPRVKLATGSNV
jgi:hypothetical protein